MAPLDEGGAGILDISLVDSKDKEKWQGCAEPDWANRSGKESQRKVMDVTQFCAI
jgi:hypothetical protein